MYDWRNQLELVIPRNNIEKSVAASKLRWCNLIWFDLHFPLYFIYFRWNNKNGWISSGPFSINFPVHKAFGSLNYCIKISNGVALDVKLEISSTVPDFEKQEHKENPFYENLTNNMKQEAESNIKCYQKWRWRNNSHECCAFRNHFSLWSVWLQCLTQRWPEKARYFKACLKLPMWPV